MGKRRIAHVVDQSFYTRQDEERQARRDRRAHAGDLRAETSEIEETSRPSRTEVKEDPSLLKHSEAEHPATIPTTETTDHVGLNDKYWEGHTPDQQLRAIDGEKRPVGRTLEEEFRLAKATQVKAPERPQRASRTRDRNFVDDGGLGGRRTPRKPRYRRSANEIGLYEADLPLPEVRIGADTTPSELLNIYADRMFAYDAFSWQTRDCISLVTLGSQLYYQEPYIDLYQLSLACSMLAIKLSPDWRLIPEHRPSISSSIPTIESENKYSNPRPRERHKREMAPTENQSGTLRTNPIKPKPIYELATIEGARKLLEPAPRIGRDIPNFGTSFSAKPSNISLSPIALSLINFKPGIG